MLNQAKTKLQNEYELIEKEKLEIALNDIENANIVSQHGKCWQLINDITGRKKSRKGIIKVRNNEERITKWFDHFKNLLVDKNLMQKTISNQHKLIMKPTYKYDI